MKLSHVFRTVVCMMVIVGFPMESTAQTREKGDWWPHPIWGADDQAGGSNWITAEKIVRAVQLVKTGKVYEVGQIYEREMPLFGATRKPVCVVLSQPRLSQSAASSVTIDWGCEWRAVSGPLQARHSPTD